MPTPIVSVLTPAKNAQRWIAGAIGSVRAQTFTDWEMIVVDDGSTDGTFETALEAAGGDTRVQVLRSQKGMGAGGARNTALDAAQGRYIAFLDADDLWDTEKLAEQTAAMAAQGWVFSWASYRVQKVDTEGHLAPAPHPVRRARTHATRKDLLSKRAPIGCLTAIYDTHAFGKVPMSTIPKRQDFVLWATLMAKAEKEGWAVGGIDTPLATYRHRGDSLSGNKWDAARMQWRALVDQCGVGRVEAIGLFLSYAARGTWDRVRIGARQR